MTTATLTYTGSLAQVSCWCGITLAIPSQLKHAMDSNAKQSCYCPIGHTFVFSEPEVDRLRRQLNNANSTAETERRWRQDTERSLAATRGVVTKLRKRVTAGACPFGCRRHFVNLERHVANKHPEQNLEGEQA